MASVHKFWKLKGSIRSTAGYKGDLSQIGRTKPVFDKETPGAGHAKRSVAESATALGGCSPLHHPFVFSFFGKFVSSSRTLAADSNTSTVYSSKFQALSPSEAFSRLLSIPSVCSPLLDRYRYSSLDGTRELSGSSLRQIGLHSPSGQLAGVSSQKARRNALKLVGNVAVASGSSNVGKEQRFFDRSTTVDIIDGASDAEVLMRKTRKLATLDSWTLTTEGIDPSCVEIEGFRLEDDEVDGIALSPSSYSKFTPNVRFAGRGSPGMRFDVHHELHTAKDLSRNLDNEGVQHGNLRLLSGACCLPHPKKVETGGEDAHFICSEEQVVGVADGVGGWADVGVNAGDYARELMLQSRIAVAQEPHGDIDPARVMLRAHARTKCRGSSTACILALSGNGLQAANLGDSGFMLVRNGRIIFKSPVQQHQFNIPFQLESGGSDSPTAAEVFSLQVAAGDVVVAGTDGLFDNLFDNELMGVVVHSTRAGFDPQITAQNIVALARERAEDRNRQTPFSTAAQEAGFRFYGGKIDDITVIVSYITTIKSGFLNS